MQMEIKIDHTADLPSALLVSTPIHDAPIFEVVP